MERQTVNCPHCGQEIEEIRARVPEGWVSHVDLGYRDVKLEVPRKHEAESRTILHMFYAGDWNAAWVRMWQALAYAIWFGDRT